jgi:hypothetical protein
MLSPEPQEIFLKVANARVGQDKKPPGRLSAGMSQPQTAATDSITAKNLPQNRPTHHGSETRQTAYIASRVPIPVKTEIIRRATVHKWTESYTVSTLVQQALAQDFGEQFAVMIRKTIQEAVKTEIQKDRDWLRKITMSNYLASEQGRLFGIELLRYILGPEEIGNLPTIIANNQRQSRENLPLYFYSISVEAEQSKWPSSK